MAALTKVKGPALVLAGRETVAHSTADGFKHLPARNDAAAGTVPIMQADGSILWGEVSAVSSTSYHYLDSFGRGDIVWQVDPGGLWDTGLCFVQIFPVIGRTHIKHIDFEFGAVGSGSDGKWGLWGGVDATGAWTLLAQSSLPNASKGLVRQAFAEIALTGYNLVALAQDPGASGVTQPVRQASTYYSPNPPSGIPAAYAYLGTHAHNATFTTLPTIPAGDAIYLMQKWSSIGVR